MLFGAFYLSRENLCKIFKNAELFNKEKTISRITQ